MSVHGEMDQCRDCGAWLPAEDTRPEGVERMPCPNCGSTKRTKNAEMHARVKVSVSVDAELIISWHEVDRLLSEAEYAAALLVAAVNIEFILWENLRHFTPTSSLAAANPRVMSTWGQIRSNHPKQVTLSGLLAVTEHMTRSDTFVLSPTWDPLVREIDDVRNRIAHERGYFERLTQLKEPDWSEPRIRQVLEDAKAFCHGNAT